jgi:hypothetical protein
METATPCAISETNDPTADSVPRTDTTTAAPTVILTNAITPVSISSAPLATRTTAIIRIGIIAAGLIHTDTIRIAANPIGIMAVSGSSATADEESWRSE